MKRLRGHRTCFLIDLENTVGTGQVTTRDARAFAAWLRRRMQPATDDLVIVAVNPYVAFVARDAFPSARLLTRHGHDGADQALVDVLRHEQLQGRFARVVLTSGDGIFADHIALLAGGGCHTQVLAPRGALSRRLRMAAHEHHVFEPDALQVAELDAS